MTGFAVSFFGFLSHSCSCGGWDLGQALGIFSLISFKSCLSCKVREGHREGGRGGLSCLKAVYQYIFCRAKETAVACEFIKWLRGRLHWWKTCCECMIAVWVLGTHIRSWAWLHMSTTPVDPWSWLANGQVVCSVGS